MQKINDGDMLIIQGKSDGAYWEFTPGHAGQTFTNTAQSYTASCPSGTNGNPVTKTVAAGSYSSTISQADADAQALNAAKGMANAALVCVPVGQPPVTGGGNTVVIRLRGQSNMVGLGDYKDYPVPAGVSELRLLSQDLSAGTEQWGIVPCTEPTGFSVNNQFGTNSFSKSRDFSLALPLAAKLKELYPGKNILIFKTAQGNAGLDVFVKGGGSYDLELRAWKWLKENAAAQGITIAHVFDLWLQGESDAANKVSRDAYFTTLDKHVNDVIKDFGVERFFIDRVGYEPTATKESEEIMIAQTLLGLCKPEVIVTNLSGAGYNAANGGLKPDNTHRTTQSLISDGTRDGEVIANFLNTGNKLPFNTEPVPALAKVYTDPAVQAKYKAMVVPADPVKPPDPGPIDPPPAGSDVYEWDFTKGSVNEVNGKVDVKVIDLNGKKVTPKFSSGLVEDGNTTAQLQTPISSKKMIIEFTALVTGTDYNWFISPGGAFSSYYNKIGISSSEVWVSPTVDYAKVFNIPKSVDVTKEHSYRIFLDGSTVSVTIDGTEKLISQNGQAMPDALTIGQFGTAHPEQRSNFIGTLKNLKITIF
jgi:hypothetical protein